MCSSDLPDGADPFIRPEATDEVIARKAQNPSDAGDLFDLPAQPFDQGGRPAPVGPLGQLGHEKGTALVLVGKKGQGQPAQQEPSHPHRQEEQRERRDGAAGYPDSAPHISRAGPLQEAVEPGQRSSDRRDGVSDQRSGRQIGRASCRERV